MTGGGAAVADAIAELYRVFAAYPRPASLVPVCWGMSAAEESALLRPLRSLSVADLSRYAHKAITSFGDAAIYRYFLPRICELIVDDGEFVSPLGWKLAHGGFGTWPEVERNAIAAFVLAMSRRTVASDPEVAGGGSLHDWREVADRIHLDRGTLLREACAADGEHADAQLAALAMSLVDVPEWATDPRLRSRLTAIAARDRDGDAAMALSMLRVRYPDP